MFYGVRTGWFFSDFISFETIHFSLYICRFCKQKYDQIVASVLCIDFFLVIPEQNCFYSIYRNDRIWEDMVKLYADMTRFYIRDLKAFADFGMAQVLEPTPQGHNGWMSVHGKYQIPNRYSVQASSFFFPLPINPKCLSHF
jgi:hypothetical protein